MLFLQSQTERPLVPLWTVKTPPTETPAVWLPQIRAFLGIPDLDTSRDAELTAFASAAVAAIEAFTGLALFETVFTAAFAEFRPQMLLVRRPFRQVLAIHYVADVTGEIVAAPADIYHVLPSAQACGTVFLGDGLEWPAAARRGNAVEIDVRSGFTAATMPPEILHALLMTVAALDRNRGDCSCGGGGGGYGSGSVYAMKSGGAGGGAEVVPAAARAMLSRWRYVRLSAI